MTSIITIVGTDGSGKTTLSDLVVDRLRHTELSSERVWLGAESHIMRPVRAILRSVWRKSSSSQQTEQTGEADEEYGGYSQEIASKNAWVRRLRFLTPVYLGLVMLDYRIQVHLKLREKRRLSLIVADRYVFDVVVNVGIALGWTPERVVLFLQKHLSKFPLPDVRIFLRVPPEVSMQRKDDIPDIDYLRMRLRYYDAIASAFGFTVRDGTLPLEKNLEWVMAHVSEELRKPTVHYVHSNNGDVGGADRVLFLLAEHAGSPTSDDIQEFRATVHLRERTSIVKHYEAVGIPVLLSDFVRPQVSGGFLGVAAGALRAPGTVWHFRRTFSRHRPDIVHVNDLYDFLPAIAAKSLKIPVVYHLRMIKESGPLKSGFAKLIPSVSDATISVSEAVRNHYFGGVHSSADKPRHLVIHDLPNPALLVQNQSPPSARPRGHQQSLLVVMIGRIEPWKGQQVYVDAVRSLPSHLRSRHRFLLVGGKVPGKDEYFDTVTRAASEVGIAVLGERDDVPSILRAADISVHCSIAPDPFPGVVVESLLAGAATIGAAGGGVPEMIRPGVDGLLVAPGNHADLSAALLKLLSSSTSPRSTFGVAGRERILGLLNAPEIDAAVAHLYEALLQSSTSVRPSPQR